MILREALEQLKDKSIRVGCERGSGFLFCGWADNKAKEVLQHHLDKEVTQIFKNYPGGTNILIDGNAHGEYWTSVECIGVDTDNPVMKCSASEAAEELVNAAVRDVANDFYKALVKLDKADAEAGEKELEYLEIMSKFSQNRNIKLVKSLGQKLIEAKIEALEAAVEASKLEDIIRSNERFIKSGAYGISPDVGAHIIDKLKKKANQEIKIKKSLESGL